MSDVLGVRCIALVWRARPYVVLYSLWHVGQAWVLAATAGQGVAAAAAIPGVSRSLVTGLESYVLAFSVL